MKENGRKWKTAKNNSFFITLVTSLVILVCIPILIFQIALIKQSSEEISNRYADYYISTLQSCSISYNEQIELLRYHALNISLDRRISAPLMDDSTAYDIFVAAQAIDSYGHGLMSVAKAGIYYPTEQYVLIDGYRRSMDVFYENVGAESVQEQLRIVDHMMDPDNRTAVYINGVLLLTRPVHLLSQSDYDGVVFFLLNITDFARLFESNLPYGIELAVRDNQNWIIHSAILQSLLEHGNSIDGFIYNAGNGVHTMQSDSGTYMIYKFTDDQAGNGYYAIVEKNQAEKSLTNYLHRILIICTASMLLCCLLAAVIAYINYKPVKKLVEKHTDGRHAALSELEQLDSAFFARDQLISNQRSLLGSLLLGDLFSNAEVKADLLDQQFGYRNFCYFAVITIVADDLNVRQIYAIAEKLQERMTSTEVFTTSIPNRSHNLFVLMDEIPINTTLAKADMILTIHEITGTEKEVKVGDVVQKLEDIQRSYDASFMDFQNVKESEDGFLGEAYPAQDVQRFVLCVCTGNVEDALVMLDKIDAYFAVQKYRDAHRQYYHYKLLSAYLGGLKENSVDLSAEEIDELIASVNFGKLFEFLRKSVKLCCGRTLRSEEQSNLSMQKKLVQYVNENLTNIDISLSSTADEFGTSIYAVSRLFKEATGIGFREYVVDKRLELSKEMLLSSNKSVTVISKECGFDNLTYFSTAFRKRYGLAPSKLRDQYNPKGD